MMSPDDVVLLIRAQWERGLIVPELPGMAKLREACDAAVEAGLCVMHPYQIGSVRAICFVLTRDGFLRYGELTHSETVFA